jgi:hypothetical protein
MLTIQFCPIYVKFHGTTGLQARVVEHIVQLFSADIVLPRNVVGHDLRYQQRICNEVRRPSYIIGSVNMTKMAIITLSPVWNVPPYLNLADHLANIGDDVKLFGYQKANMPTREVRASGATVLRISLLSRSIPVAALRQLAAFLEYRKRLSRELAMHDWARCFVFNDEGLGLVWTSPSRRLLPKSVVWLLEYHELGSVRLADKYLLRRSIAATPHVPHVAVPNEARADLLMRQRKLRMPPVVVHNAPLRHEVQKIPANSATITLVDRMRIARAESRVVMIYAGAIGQVYAIPELLRAAQNYRSKLFLVLVSRRYPEAEKEVQKALQQGDNQHWLYWADEIPYDCLQSVLVHADIGVVMYKPDTANTRSCAPGKMYEYMKAGLSVFTTCSNPFAGELEQHDAGIVAKDCTPNGIGEALRLVVADRTVLRKQGATSRGLFESKYNFEKQVEPLLEAIK